MLGSLEPLSFNPFADAEAAFPTSPDVLNYHGELLVEAQDFDGAKTRFTAALKVCSSNACHAILSS